MGRLTILILFMVIMGGCYSQLGSKKEPKHLELTENGLNVLNGLTEVDSLQLKEIFNNFHVKPVHDYLEDSEYYGYDILDDSKGIHLKIRVVDFVKNQIESITILQGNIKDQYGVKINDIFKNLKDKRKSQGEWVTDFSQNTYVWYGTSSIRYMIFGDFNIEEQEDPELPKFTKDQIEDWRVEQIIWMKK